jgi:hypothetical protein
MIRLLQIVVLLVMVVAGEVSAQGPRAALQQVGTGKLVRVATDGQRVQGRITAIEGDNLILSIDDRARPVVIAEIDTLWRRRGAHGKGAVIGGVIGAAAFTGFLHFVVTIACESSDGCPGDRRRAWGYGLALGGAGGALLGAGIGGLFNRWERLEP